jgi:hypothetical protein
MATRISWASAALSMWSVLAIFWAFPMVTAGFGVTPTLIAFGGGGIAAWLAAFSAAKHVIDPVNLQPRRPE